MIEHPSKARPPVVEFGADRPSAELAAAWVDRDAQARGEAAPILRLGRLSSLRVEAIALGEAIDQLRATAARLGGLNERRGGLRGRVERLVKRVVRRLVQRHLDQQREVNEAALRALEHLHALLERERALLDENAIEIEDHAARQETTRAA